MSKAFFYSRLRRQVLAATLVAGLCVAFMSEARAQTARVDTTGLTSLQQQRITSVLSAWQKKEGAGIQSSLGIVNGKATMVLFITSDGTPAESARRDDAVLTALQFLLADDAFETVHIVVHDLERNGLPKPKIKAVDVTRLQYRGAVVLASKLQTINDGVSRARGNATIASQILASVGVGR